MHKQLQPIHQSDEIGLYEYDSSPGKQNRIFVASTPETRVIVNDPFVTGLRYTRTLSRACARTLSALRDAGAFVPVEGAAKVLHILRGGLNFGLREALGDAFGWNDHGSLYVSAQRARTDEDPQLWHITESDYRKLHLGSHNDIFFGDVVATGTSLEYALGELGRYAAKHGSQINSISFFTIGGPRAYEIMESLHGSSAWRQAGLVSSNVIFFEGIFSVAHQSTKMHVKIDGTDLLRTKAVLPPELIDSQYSDPAYPIERCTIYDAGSRAFELSEYIEDVHEYWSQTLALAKQGMSYSQLLAERFPELNAQRFNGADLERICVRQLESCNRLLATARGEV
ncbi:MAG: hypothetical protein QY326_00260 [Bdellovibrionota bacterium]|nr:MAG: hypothetical protein QY326_00260 [Bdellovibrionota bacterium]